MSAEENLATALSCYEALDRHDLGAVGPLLSDDYVYRNGPGVADVVQGRDAFLAYEQQAFEAFPDLRIEVLTRSPTGNGSRRACAPSART